MESIKQEENTIFGFNYPKSIPDFTIFYHLLAIVAGLIYLSGYLVTQIYLRNLGIDSNSIFKTQYIETGIVFIFFIITSNFIPYFSISFTKTSIWDKNYGLAKKIPLFAITFLIRFSFVAFFPTILLLTKHDWNIHCDIPYFHKSLRTLVTIHFASFLLGSYLIPIIERLKD